MTSVLSSVVSTSSLRDKASAGPIAVPGVCERSRSKSCKNMFQRACRLESLCGVMVFLSPLLSLYAYYVDVS